MFASTKTLLFCFLFFWTCNTCLAQSSDSATVWVNMKNGLVYSGQMVEISDNSYVIFVEDVGNITLFKRNIAKLSFSEIQSSVNSTRFGYLQEAGSTEYFWVPSARNLKAKQFRYKNAFIFFNSFEFGINDNLSVAVNVELASLFGDTALPGLSGWLKYSLPIVDDKLYGTVGLLFGFASFDNLSSGAIAYGGITYGSVKNNLTLGVGHGTDFTAQSRPTYLLSGMVHLGEKAAFVSSNGLVLSGNEIGVFSFSGFRFYFPQSFQLDLGSLILSNFGDSFAIPSVSLAITPPR